MTSPMNSPHHERTDDKPIPTNFHDFYPCYLRGHRHPVNRAIHYGGAACVFASAVAVALTGNFWIFAGAVACTYAVLWISHALVEHNVPVTLHGGWRPVVFSICGEFYMTWRYLTGRLREDLRRAQIGDEGKDELQ